MDINFDDTDGTRYVPSEVTELALTNLIMGIGHVLSLYSENQCKSVRYDMRKPRCVNDASYWSTTRGKEGVGLVPRVYHAHAEHVGSDYVMIYHIYLL